MSTALAVVEDHAGIDLAEQRARLPELVQDGDTEELAAIAHAAKLLRLHEKAKGHAEEANAASWLKVEAEAGIGVIDIQENPRRSGGVLLIGPDAVSQSKRSDYRCLGYADLQGLLAATLTEMAERRESITTSTAVERVREKGAGNLDPMPFAEALRAAKLRGISKRAVLQRVGMSHFDHQRAITYENGIALARELGMDTTALAPMPRTRSLVPLAERRRKRRAKEAKWQRETREQQRLAKWKARDDRMRERGGKVTEIYSLVRKAEQMASGARDGLQTKEAKAELDSAVFDLMEVAAKLDRAAALG